MGLDSYILDYSRSDAFVSGTDVTFQETGFSESYRSLTGLIAGATYYWKVTPVWNGTPGTPSETFHFIVDNGSSSIQPLIGGPANNLAINTTAPMLSWVMPAEAKDGLTYRLEIVDNNAPDWSNSKKYEGVKDPYAVVDGLEKGKYYKWRVSSSTDDNYPIPPNYGVFKVDDDAVTSVADEVIPTKFAVAQNYPNPFNPTTTINYQIPEASFVSIKIYNMLGQEVKTLVNKEHAAGSFDVVWQGNDNFGSKVSSGTYIYRVTTGKNVITKKMVLLK